MRKRSPSPLPATAVLTVVALIGMVALVSFSSAKPASHVQRAIPTMLAEKPGEPQFHHARSDSDAAAGLIRSSSSDSLETFAADTLRLDTLSTVFADTGRAPTYMGRFFRDGYAARFAPRYRNLRTPVHGSYWNHEVQLDTTGQYYVLRERVDDRDVRYPIRADLETYRRERLSADMNQSWRDLIEQRTLQRADRRGGLGLNIVIPGGRQSAFTSIFGRPEVDLRVNGQANIDAGFAYQRSDQQLALGRSSRTDPRFGQDIRLGVTGRIGDKLSVDVNWDTERDFDYQNQLKLEYEGYEDEIIRSIEAGNVSLPTPSTLISGGQSLFGIKSHLQLGGLSFVTLMSQQEGVSDELSIDGGTETTEFEIRPTEYENNVHFFLGYYFHNTWERAYSNPPRVVVDGALGSIVEVEVWKSVQSSMEHEEVSRVVAVTDLGEPSEVLGGTQNLGSNPALPDPDLDQYTPTHLEFLRSGTNSETDIDNFLQTQVGQPLSQADYEVGRFRRLREGQDYDFDRALGYISLRSRAAESEAIAVAFRYSGSAGAVQVGDFREGGDSERQDGRRMVLKLVKGPNQQPNESMWDLTLRNIYRIPGRAITPNDFDLRIYFEEGGQTPSQTLPGVTVGSRQQLLGILGLDRVNEDGAPSPDNRFDYITNYTIDPQNGRIIFPYLRPFGEHMERVIMDEELTTISGQLGREAAVERFAFRQLYNQRLTEAQQLSRYDIYRIRGSYRGNVQETYNLGAFGIVEGSVRVTSGGSPLSPSDYVVDYSTGTVTITNQAYLTAGQDIRIRYERNQFAQIQKKTLLGMRADYRFRDNLEFGATALRLSERPVIDKFRVGEEPISNLIWGLDGKLDLQPRWLTRAVDALPLVQTRAPSSIQLSGEFAQLRPGHAQTTAFQQRRRDIRRQGLDFAEDEMRGISYIDDFEGVRTTFSLMQPGMWHHSSPPQTIRPPEAVTDSLRTNWKGKFAWYTVPQNVYRELGIGSDADPAIRRILIQEAFPGRDVRGETNREIQTFDVHFDPSKRGPYNFTRDMPSFLDHPQDTWGGMMMALPDGYRDFSLQNIEAVEFIFRPFADNDLGEAGSNAKLYIEIGLISEDIIPNGRLNTEDGLSVRSIEEGDLDNWGRRSTGRQDGVVEVDRSTNRTQDLGLNGLPSHNDYTASHPYEVTEQDFYADFLQRMEADLGVDHPEYQRALLDPAADDFFYWNDNNYFGNPALFPGGASLQDRFSRFFTGLELNSIQAQRDVAGGGAGISRYPDSEDINMNGRLDTENSYYQYSIPLTLSDLEEMAHPANDDNFVVDRIKNDNIPGSFDWYMVRIPVREFMDKIGEIEDFHRIEFVRMWTTGHEDPVTMRFARFDLVGNQWKKADEIGDLTNDASQNTSLFVSTINNEENSFYKSPPTAVISQVRTTTGTQQLAREQSMLLRAHNLLPGDKRAVFRRYNQGQDLLRYSNLRMFMHGHGFDDRDDLRMFIRLGHNETSDYYEYEQPVTPSDPLADAETVWQVNQVYNGERLDLNSVNIELSALNVLKVNRDEALARGEARLDSIFTVQGTGIEEFAPPGTRIGIKGNPSLSRITSITIGVRNPADSTSGRIVEDATLWVNELRVSGYDESNGWAAIGAADIRLADLATIRANIRRQTDGFGGLSSGLGEREMDNVLNWSLTTSLNMHRLLPERYGWNIPVTYSIRSNVATPRFSPDRGDIRLDEMLAQVNERTDLNEFERQQQRDQIIQEAQRASFSQSVNIPFRKTNSQLPILRYTLDALNVSYSWNQSEARNPSTRLNDSWQWSSAMNYNLRIQRPRTIRPFWFIEAIPLLNMLDLRLNYIPQQISASASAQRQMQESRERARTTGGQDLDPDFVPTPELIQYPLRQNHRFSHRRTFNLQHNPFQFLTVGYDSQTDQSLRTISLDTLHNVITIDRTTRQESIFRNIGVDEAISSGLVDTSVVDAYQFDRLNLLPASDVVNRLFTSTGGVRTNQYSQNFNATYRPNFDNIGILDWIQIQPVAYTGTFNWTNGPIAHRPEDELGASVSNRVSLRTGVQMRPVEFWRKFDFYQDLEQQQREAENRASAARARRDQERENRRRNGGSNDNGDTESAEADTTESSGFRLPTPNFGSILRRTFLTVTGLRDMSFTYQRNQNASSGNISGGFGLLDGFRGTAPPLAYRLGIQRIIDPEFRILRDDLQVVDRLDQSNQVNARTSLTPSTNLRIDLTWELNWSEGENITYGVDEGRIQTVATQSGRNRSTVWAFGGSYDDLFKRQLEAYNRDVAGLPAGEPVRDQNQDGRVVLSQKSVVDDFNSSFLRSIGTFDGHGLLPIPLPNWAVNYTGLNQIDLIRKFARSITVVHRYNATYETDFRSSEFAGQERTINQRLEGRTIYYTVPEISANSVRINQNFRPFIGFNVTWQNDFQTDINWHRGHSRSLSAGRSSISSNQTNELSLNASYSKRGFRLPFMDRATSSNTLRLSMTLTRAESIERMFNLGDDLDTYLRNREGEDPTLLSSTRMTVEPRISYVFSTRVTSDLYVRFEHLDSQGSQIPTTTNVSGGFNVRVNIAN